MASPERLARLHSCLDPSDIMHKILIILYELGTDTYVLNVLHCILRIIYVSMHVSVVPYISSPRHLRHPDDKRSTEHRRIKNEIMIKQLHELPYAHHLL